MTTDAERRRAAAREVFASLGIGARARNGLWRSGIRSVDDLLAQTRRDLLDIRSFGVGCLSEVEDALARAGHALADVRVGP